MLFRWRKMKLHRIFAYLHGAPSPQEVQQCNTQTFLTNGFLRNNFKARQANAFTLRYTDTVEANIHDKTFLIVYKIQYVSYIPMAICMLKIKKNDTGNLLQFQFSFFLSPSNQLWTLSENYSIHQSVHTSGLIC